MFRTLAAAAAAQFALTSIAAATTYSVEWVGTYWYTNDVDTAISEGDEIRVAIKGGQDPTLEEVTPPYYRSDEAAGVAGYSLLSVTIDIPSIGFQTSTTDAFIGFVDDLPTGTASAPDIIDAILVIGQFGFGLGAFQTVFSDNTFDGVGYHETLTTLSNGSPFDVSPSPTVFAPIYTDIRDAATITPLGTCPTSTGCRISWLGETFSVAAHDDVPAPVPLPAGLPLLMGGLGILGLNRFRRA